MVVTHGKPEVVAHMFEVEGFGESSIPVSIVFFPSFPRVP